MMTALAGAIAAYVETWDSGGITKTFGGSSGNAFSISGTSGWRDREVPRISAGWTRITSWRSGRPLKYSMVRSTQSSMLGNALVG